MDACSLCPNACGIDREKNAGACSVKSTMKIAKYYAHPFEEPPVSGTQGSGTVFFTGCPVKCVFCQNYELSRGLRGREITPENLADIFRFFDDSPAHNINLVTATHFAEGLLKAFSLYRPRKPVVLNSHGYESLETLRRLNPYIDVYLPDMKFVSPKLSFRYTGKKNYFSVAKEAVEYMIREKTPVYENGLIKQGVIVRHLVLPGCVEDTKRVLDWFAPFKTQAAFSLMSQYTPFGEIENFPELKRRISRREYSAALSYALSLGITDLYAQKRESAETSYIPAWDD